jgi:hypothetical protein
VRHGFGDAGELSAACPDALVDDFAGLLRLARQRGW